MNEAITYHVLQEAINAGVREFMVCAGGRNSSFIEALKREERLTTYYWPEERSAAFFALGRSKQTRRPVAVVVTSGTAAAELLPATMEAYYSGIPLLLLTTDRPRSFRGSGAPQSAEQVGLFSHYTSFAHDLTNMQHPLILSHWDRKRPAQVNVCLDEPQGQPPFMGKYLTIEPQTAMIEEKFKREQSESSLHRFFGQIEKPLVIVSALPQRVRNSVADFLLKLNAPIFLEGPSGLREDSRLQHLRIHRTERILESATQANYPIDGVLRIGGVPTHRIWRDLENHRGHIKVCSLSHLPFSGLSWNRNVICAPLDLFLPTYIPASFNLEHAQEWLGQQSRFKEFIEELFIEEQAAEPSLMHFLSKAIPANSHVFLGNSLPIREWDMAAETNDKGLEVTSSRGVNGIDGQIATFLGLCESDRENWAIIGDLTALYDMAGFWVLPQLGGISANVAIINNGGGQLFSRIFPNNKEMLNMHNLSFKPLADMWGLEYDLCKGVPNSLRSQRNKLIEFIPDSEATARFWRKLGEFDNTYIGAHASK